MNAIYYPSLKKITLEKNNKLTLEDSKQLFNPTTKEYIVKINNYLNDFKDSINEKMTNEELSFLERVENAKKLFYKEIVTRNENVLELINIFITRIDLNSRNKRVEEIKNEIPNSITSFNEIELLLSNVHNDEQYNSIVKYCNMRYQSIIVKIYKDFKLCAELSKSEYDDLIIGMLETIKEKLNRNSEEYCGVSNLLNNCKIENYNNKDKWRKIKCYSPKELKSIAERNGYSLVSIRGSHYKYYNKDKHDICIIPLHSSISKSLSNSIYNKIIK